MSETQERWGVWCKPPVGDGGFWAGHMHPRGPELFSSLEAAESLANHLDESCGERWTHEAREYTDPRDERIATLAAENARLREENRKLQEQVDTLTRNRDNLLRMLD